VIEDFFTSDAEHLTLKIFLDSKYNPNKDIELFLKARFSEIRRGFRISSAWPGDDAIQWIIDTASGQFIFAATVIRYISDPSSLPQRRLEHILCRLSQGTKGGNPYGTLDRLYVHIFNSSPNPKLAVTWIGAIAQYNDELPANYWIRFFETVEGEATYVLGNLASLISIPPPHDDSTPFRLYHKSLLDFLLDETRSGDLFQDPSEWVSLCAKGIIGVLRSMCISSILFTLVHDPDRLLSL
jgi:hypothetical protein